MATYKLISYAKYTNYEDIVVKSYPSKLARLLGFKSKEIRYHGDCTVWHEFPSGKRPGTMMESLICDLVTGYKMRKVENV